MEEDLYFIPGSRVRCSLFSAGFRASGDPPVFWWNWYFQTLREETVTVQGSEISRGAETQLNACLRPAVAFGFPNTAPSSATLRCIYCWTERIRESGFFFFIMRRKNLLLDSDLSIWQSTTFFEDNACGLQQNRWHAWLLPILVYYCLVKLSKKNNLL